MHAVVFAENHKFFGVFDGHFGSLAARYAAKQLHGLFELWSSESYDVIKKSSNDANYSDTHILPKNAGINYTEYILKYENNLHSLNFKTGVNWMEVLELASYEDVVVSPNEEDDEADSNYCNTTAMNQND
jgi:hypothetical protein